MRAPRLLAVTVALVLVAALGACSDDEDTSSTGSTEPVATTLPPGGDFYEIPDPLPAGPPGTIIRSEPITGAPDGAQAWLVLYTSTDVSGEPIATSGVIVAPADPPAPPAGRPVVAWGHPTTGVAQQCAPSIGTPFAFIEGLTDLLAAGFVVAAPDYSGLGAAGPPSYLIGDLEGRNLLDAARAARNLPETGAGDEVVLWGHSQGGHAALFAGQLAPDYAPDLQVLGVAVAAPATLLADLVRDDEQTGPGVSLSIYAMVAYEQAYQSEFPGLDGDDVLTPAAQEAVPQLEQLCDLTQSEQVEAIADPLAGNVFAEDPTTTAPWSELLARNTTGAVPILAPVFIAQGDQDTIVEPSVTEDYAAELCEQGSTVQLTVYPGQTHETIALVAAPDVVAWAQGLLAGEDAPSTC